MLIDFLERLCLEVDDAKRRGRPMICFLDLIAEDESSIKWAVGSIALKIIHSNMYAPILENPRFLSFFSSLNIQSLRSDCLKDGFWGGIALPIKGDAAGFFLIYDDRCRYWIETRRQSEMWILFESVRSDLIEIDNQLVMGCILKSLVEDLCQTYPVAYKASSGKELELPENYGEVLNKDFRFIVENTLSSLKPGDVKRDTQEKWASFAEESIQVLQEIAHNKMKLSENRFKQYQQSLRDLIFCVGLKQDDFAIKMQSFGPEDTKARKLHFEYFILTDFSRVLHEIPSYVTNALIQKASSINLKSMWGVLWEARFEIADSLSNKKVSNSPYFIPYLARTLIECSVDDYLENFPECKKKVNELGIIKKSFYVLEDIELHSKDPLLSLLASKMSKWSDAFLHEMSDYVHNPGTIDTEEANSLMRFAQYFSLATLLAINEIIKNKTLTLN